MKFNLSLKDSHVTVIDGLKIKNSISSYEEVVKKFVKSALKLKNNDFIFGVEQEKCSSGCFSSESQFEVDMDEDDFNKLKKVYQDYNFDNYKTEEEEISKTIRCIINFIEDKPELISI